VARSAGKRAKSTKKAVRSKRAALSVSKASKAPANSARAAKQKKQRPIELYYWPTGNGRKIVIYLEEVGASYQIKPVNIGKGDQFRPDFLKISPNNRMPAIIDPDGPDGKPISVFESGAILQYLGRKFGKLYPQDERARVEVEEWVYWQVGGLGPMAGQAHHFRGYAHEVLKEPMERIEYGITRYTNEVTRLYGVLDRRLKGRKFVAGAEYTIADIAIWPWIVPWQRQGQNLDDFKNLKAWYARVDARPAVKRSAEIGRAIMEAARREQEALSEAEKLKRGRMLYAQGAKK
jgi:GSH-dependent disulfide-bond oxidoreductase